MTEDFLPKDYKAPSTSGKYLNKFPIGNTKIRIVSKPLLGWIDWKDEDGKKTPLRFSYENKPEPINPEKPVKHFWAFIVWNYESKMIQIMDITQKTIQSPIQTLVESEDWGSPIDYDITIKRVGSTMEDTEYSVTPAPPKPLTDEIKAIVDEIKVDLTKLLAGLDPFALEPTDEEVNADEISF